MIVRNEELDIEPLVSTIETLKLLKMPVSETHSMLFTTLGQCLVNSSSITTRRCQPECFAEIGTNEMCKQPLGKTITLRAFEWPQY